MGTQYHITLVSSKQQINAQVLQKEIDQHLADINQKMSTYINDSEISLFNQATRMDWLPISKELLIVIQASVKAHNISDGAFDPTVYPLVDLWGFAKQIKITPPSNKAVQITRQYIGLGHLKIRANPPALSKDTDKLSLDLSAIAKGYGVDAIAELLDKRGLTNYLVEIGGEIKARGRNKNNKTWHIAIEQPKAHHMSKKQNIIDDLYLHNQAVATSGNYRNYYEYEGKRYAHTINPATGKPAENTLASVTIIHPSAMWADAMATTIMVMGAKQGLAFANKQKLAVFMITYDGGSYDTIANQHFLNFQENKDAEKPRDAPKKTL